MSYYTYRDLIRKYSDDVDKGYADADLTPRQRRLVVVMLNTASNDAFGYYPPDEADRDAAVKRLNDILWDARPLMYALFERNTGLVDRDISIAAIRTNEILRNM